MMDRAGRSTAPVLAIESGKAGRKLLIMISTRRSDEMAGLPDPKAGARA
jgi:hypothetical protein